MRPLVLSLATLALLSSGCRPAPPEAPTELDDLVHFFLQQIDGDDGALVADGADNLGDWYRGSDDVGEDGASGQISSVTTAEADALDDLRWDPDPSRTVGVYTARVLPCTLAQIEAIFLEPDQMSLFPDNYVDYVRTFDSDPACYEAGDCDECRYHSTNTDKLVGFEMVYEMWTVMRRFRHVDDEGVERRVLLVRNVMPEPAEESIETGGYEQSYHIEAHVPWGGGDEVLHLYGLWNYGYLEGIDDDIAFWPNQYIDGLVELDDQLAALCAEGR